MIMNLKIIFFKFTCIIENLVIYFLLIIDMYVKSTLIV